MKQTQQKQYPGLGLSHDQLIALSEYFKSLDDIEGFVVYRGHLSFQARFVLITESEVVHQYFLQHYIKCLQNERYKTMIAEQVRFVAMLELIPDLRNFIPQARAGSFVDILLFPVDWHSRTDELNDVYYSEEPFYIAKMAQKEPLFSG